MRADLDNLLSDLDTLTSEREFRSKFESTFREFGFNVYCYLGIKGDAARAPYTQPTAADVISLNNLPVGWYERYAEQGYGEQDPILKQSMARRMPLSWTERLRQKTWNARENQIMSECFDFGLRRGFTVPIHGPYGELGIVSLYSDLTDREFLKSADLHRYDVHMISLYLHDAIQKTLTQGEDVPKPIPLTDREVEIIRWTAIGKTAWEIGSILKISERTVNFHLQNLMGKLGVHNKTHAAAKAMSFGLIQP
jgi:DNA-binding CsgD family transcriptional regulator